MNPQSPNFFSSRNYTPAPRDFSSSSNVQGGGSFSQKLKNLSKNTKILIIVAIAAVILISLFAIIGGATSSSKNVSSTDEEFVRLLDDFSNEAYYFTTSYDNYIGFNPSLNAEENPIFPFEEIDAIDLKLISLEEINSEIQSFDERQSNFKSKSKDSIAEFKTNLNTALADARENVDFLKQIKNAFYDWFYESQSSGSCINSKDILALVSSGDETISKIASDYKSVLCEIATQSGGVMTEESLNSIIQNNSNNLTNVFKDIENKLKPIDAEAFDLSSISANLNEEGN